MLRRYTTVPALSLAALLFPIASSAQDNQPPPEVQEWIEEMQRIEVELRPLQQEAMEDPALQREQQEVAGFMRDVIVQADPENGERLDRMEAIMEQAQAAQQSGDTERIAALTTEAAEIQPEIEQAQAQALREPEVQTRIAQFQENLRAKMIEIDPAAKPRIERLQELSERVQALTTGRSG